MASPAGSPFARSRLLMIAAYSGFVSALLAVAALAGFILVVGDQTISEAADSSAFFLPTSFALGSTIALLVALCGLYVFQQDRLSSMGVVAFVVAIVGTALAAGAQWTYLFVVPHFADAAPRLIDEGTGTVLVGFILSYATMALGWIMFGVASMRIGLVPRKGAIAMIVGAAVAILPMPSRTLVLSLAVAYVASRLRASAHPDLG